MCQGNCINFVCLYLRQNTEKLLPQRENLLPASLLGSPHLAGALILMILMILMIVKLSLS